MAKNLEDEKPVESDSESGEEEIDGSSSEDGSTDSDSEPEESEITKKSLSLPLATLKKSLAHSSKTQQQQPSSSSDDENSGSESESESESDGSDTKVKPIASKPMVDPPKPNASAKKPRSKPSASEPVTPAKATGTKRPAEEKKSEAKDAKKSRKKPEPENSEKKSTDDSKKQLFQRIWSEEDEIVILKGMIDYAEKKKSDPVADLNAFHNFIKDDLHVDVTRTQLQHKIRRLKQKYENNKAKEKDGKGRALSKPHEQKAYELSKLVWGNESGKGNGGEKLVVGSPKRNVSSAKKTNKTANVENIESEDVKHVVAVDGNVDKLAAEIVSWNDASMEARISRIGAELFEGDNRVEGEQERVWRKLKVQEMEVYLKKLDLMRAKTKLVLDVLKSGDH
ncbi:hypothetical protein DH2020_032976 [Rehmannia glutinosa]|uniref:Glabrous enhancer-binding protein-like DBD domain-containing protein n=1 Tax=Rehmannia glutinosa TaxID=99300 RepID=A0ABR0VDP6_REHGL